MAAILRGVSELASRITSDFGLTPVMAAELEFYLPGPTIKEQAVEAIRAACVSLGFSPASVAAEVGKDQFEVAFTPTADSAELVKQHAQLKQALASANFAARPFEDQPGSGLHIHLHLQDAQGKNVFTRAGRDMDDPFSDALLQTLGGMLALMNPCMRFFAPTDKSYARFVPKSNAPLTVSWGTNNRTVALRLPSKALDNKHIEHRVAGSDADMQQVLSAVLAGAHYGLKAHSNPGEAIYGDAALAQYKLPTLARSTGEAEKHFNNNIQMLKDYIT